MEVPAQPEPAGGRAAPQTALAAAAGACVLAPPSAKRARADEVPRCSAAGPCMWLSWRDAASVQASAALAL